MNKQLLPPDVAAIADEHPEYVSDLVRHRSWNYAINMLDIGTYAIPLAILSEATVVPYLVSQLTESALIIGVLPSLNWVGIHLPQIVGAYLVHGRRARKPTIVRLAWLERAAIFGIFLTTLSIGTVPAAVTLALFLVMYTTLWGVTGLFIPAYSDFYAKHIVMGRGFFYGIQTLVSGVMGLVGAYIINWQLETARFPDNFQMLFAIAFVLSLPGMIAIHNMREVIFPRPFIVQNVTYRERLSAYFAEIPGLLRENGDYVRVLVGISVMSLGKMSIPFIAVYAIERYGLPGSIVAVYSGLLLGARSATALLWGYLTDRIGYRWLWMIYGLLLVLYALISLLAPSAGYFYVVFAIIGAAMGMETAVRPETIYQLSPPSETPRFVGLSNTLLALPFLVGPLLAGVLVDQFSFETALAATLVVTLLALPPAYLLIVHNQRIRKLRTE